MYGKKAYRVKKDAANDDAVIDFFRGKIMGDDP